MAHDRRRRRRGLEGDLLQVRHAPHHRLKDALYQARDVAQHLVEGGLIQAQHAAGSRRAQAGDRRRAEQDGYLTEVVAGPISIHAAVDARYHLDDVQQPSSKAKNAGTSPSWMSLSPGRSRTSAARGDGRGLLVRQRREEGHGAEVVARDHGRSGPPAVSASV